MNTEIKINTHAPKINQRVIVFKKDNQVIGGVYMGKEIGYQCSITFGKQLHIFHIASDDVLGWIENPIKTKNKPKRLPRCR